MSRFGRSTEPTSNDDSGNVFKKFWGEFLPTISFDAFLLLFENRMSV
jgi:hypothetical protein